MRTRQDEKNNFRSVFNPENGKYLRVTNDNPSGKDAFMSSMPELIDIGIMGKCDRGCAYCYQDAKPTGNNMSLDNYVSLLNQVKDDVYQVALGGAGNPNEHEDFEEILRATREDFNIVPSYTTNGDNLTNQQIAISKKYCGAVAVSKHEGDNWLQAVKRLIDAGVKTNIHFILSNDTIEEALNILENPEIFLEDYKDKLNAIIFLLYKPFGRGVSKTSSILKDSIAFRNFSNTIKEWKGSFKIGFDSCSTPFLLDFDIADPKYLDTCEGGRYSCYIGPDMIMTPCSFDVDKSYGVDLNSMTPKAAWNGQSFDNFRESMSGCSCKCNEDKKWDCKGGCPLTSSIVICNDKGKRL